MRNNDVLFVLFVLVLVLAIIVFAPFATIWSMNTLFGLGIDYTFWTWLAMAWLSTVTFGGVAYNVRRKDRKD
jgi:hypothetical protein